ncbi:MAG TPA: response regulator [Methylomirabilota bacterium]|nr:response regulator [Methylomirabilota bacterium]
MVAESRTEFRRSIAEYFTARGWQVTVAGDGVAALAQAVTHPVDVVIVAAGLPGLDGWGYETAALLKRLSPRAQVILTTDADEDLQPRENEHLERFRCFPKPLNLESIARAIEDPNAEDAR